MTNENDSTINACNGDLLRTDVTSSKRRIRWESSDGRIILRSRSNMLLQFTVGTLVIFVTTTMLIYYMLNKLEETEQESMARLQPSFPIDVNAHQPWKRGEMFVKRAEYEHDKKGRRQDKDVKQLNSVKEYLSDYNLPVSGIGETRLWYIKLRQKYDSKYPFDISDKASSLDRLLKLASSLREHQYTPIENLKCPDKPPPGYPKQWKMMDIIRNWNPDDTSDFHTTVIYQGICVFDHQTESEKANNYREAEVPFVLRNHVDVLRTVERWNDPSYMTELLREDEQKTEYSQSNHLMWWKLRGGSKRGLPDNWKPPTEIIKMKYSDWVKKAKDVNHKQDSTEKPHWYFRINGCGNGHTCGQSTTEFLFDELPFFKPVKSPFIIDPKQPRGINCRFGMTGNIAENHFDSSRNMVALLGGERRYMLASPSQCLNLELYPLSHPSGRHSAVDWSNPDLKNYPNFKNAMGNEIVLQAGDVLYLPTFWFHYIISLNTNLQCNARSGVSHEYRHFITECGF
eukprot:CAMPEP_0194375770 /NCGR_PEP_ID=MMETSP0174-20130528/24328_1 /TAXON_ID=216777 /ORGANISM="Proboscia alata, Strain PI-D3" /LENGTH=512 /DNA_ID=CAMNT_0039156199 /DNA_START=116 /DNA_END=1654 /DNA_ORIENTATION=-